MREIIIGSPVITKNESRGLVANMALGLTFPVSIKVTNLSPRQLAIPDFGIDLLDCLNSPGSSKTVVVDSLESLQRMAGNAQSIAELNSYRAAISIILCAIEKPADAVLLDTSETNAEINQDQKPEETEKPVDEVVEVAATKSGKRTK